MQLIFVRHAKPMINPDQDATLWSLMGLVFHYGRHVIMGWMDMTLGDKLVGCRP